MERVRGEGRCDRERVEVYKEGGGIKRKKERSCDESRNQAVPEKVTSTNNDVT